MSKAYMSDRAARNAAYGNGPGDDGPLAIAETVREARAILADTQGGTETYRERDIRFEGRVLIAELSRNRDRQGVAELAEALAAFVALDIE